LNKLAPTPTKSLIPETDQALEVKLVTMKVIDWIIGGTVEFFKETFACLFKWIKDNATILFMLVTVGVPVVLATKNDDARWLLFWLIYIPIIGNAIKQDKKSKND